MHHPPTTLSDARIRLSGHAAFTIDMAIIIAIWCVSTALVNPIGDFPLCDDWHYRLLVQDLVTTRSFHPGYFIAAPSVTNIIWGALFGVLFGVDSNVLRLSTLVAALIATIGCYTLARDTHQPRWLSLFIAAVLAFNPIFFAASHTFQTDVPCIALMIWSAVFFVRALKSNSAYQVSIGAGLALLATLSRELPLCIPLAYALIVLLSEKITLRRAVSAFAPFIFCAVGFLAYKLWILVTGRAPPLDDQTSAVLLTLTSPSFTAKVSFDNALVMLVYLGLFLLPILLVSAAELFRSGTLTRLSRANPKSAMALVSAGVLTMVLGAIVRTRYGVPYFTTDHELLTHDFVYLFGNPLEMPMSGFFLLRSGLGPVVLRDTWMLNLDHPSPLPSIFWIITTIVGFVSALLFTVVLSAHSLTLVPKFLRRTQLCDSERVGAFLILSAIGYLTPLLLSPWLADEYLIPSIPFFAVGIITLSRGSTMDRPQSTGYIRVIAASFLMAFAVYAISGTHDYLGWNRTRWEALRNLMDTNKVSPEDIDGGVEFNGLYLYDRNYHPDPHDPLNRGRSWWWVKRDTYAITLGAMPDYNVFKRYTYRRWLPLKDQEVLVLRKK